MDTTTTTEINQSDLVAQFGDIYRHLTRGEYGKAETLAGSLYGHYSNLGFDSHTVCKGRGHCNYIPQCEVSA